MLTLTLISPVYNEEDRIIPFLESVVAQTWPDFEFIIIDDGSVDQTASLIEMYLSRFGRRAQFLRHEKNEGEMATVAEAFSRATGDVCIKLDADSWLEPDTVAKIMETFAADEQTGLVTAIIKAIDRSNWLLRGAEVLCAAQQRCDQLEDDYTKTAYGTCFAFRRHIFTIEEISSRWDIDLSQLARKRGWKIALQKDLIVRTRFPALLRTVFARGRWMAWQQLPTYWRHKELLLTRWGFWTKFAPLGLALTALLKPKWALTGLLAWLGGAQVFLAHMVPDYPLSDRLAGWGVSVVRWSGFDLEMLLVALRAAANRLRTR